MEGGWKGDLPFSLTHLLFPLGIVLPSPRESLVFILFSSFWEVLLGRGFLAAGIVLVVVGIFLRSFLRGTVNVDSPLLLPPLILGMEVLRQGMSVWFSTLYHVHGPSFSLIHVGGEVVVGSFLLWLWNLLWRKTLPGIYR